MYLKIKILFILIISAVIFSGCSLLNDNNTFYSNSEQSLLDNTLNSLDYGYGFDYEMSMNYIYSYSYSKDNPAKKEKAFTDILNASNFKSVIDLYEKILKLQALTDYKLNRYNTEKNWKYYTFIKNDLYEPLKTYSDMLSKYILQKNANLAQYFEMRKKSYQVEIVMENQDKDTITDTF